MGGQYDRCKQNQAVSRKFWLFNISVITFCQVLK